MEPDKQQRGQWMTSPITARLCRTSLRNTSKNAVHADHSTLGRGSTSARARTGTATVASWQRWTCSDAATVLAGLARRTANTGAVRRVAREALAAITGSGQAGRATHVGVGTAGAIAETDLTRATADAVATVARTTVRVSTTGATVGRTGGHAHTALTGQTGAAEVLFRITALTELFAVFRCEGSPDTTETKNAAKGRGGDGFESLAP